MNPQKYCTVKEAADILEVDPSRVRQMIGKEIPRDRTLPLSIRMNLIERAFIVRLAKHRDKTMTGQKRGPKKK